MSYVIIAVALLLFFGPIALVGWLLGGWAAFAMFIIEIVGGGWAFVRWISDKDIML